MDASINEGIELFNSEKFFEAHEALEAVWLKAQGTRKVFLHGLIQVAAAFHHHRGANREGFSSLLEKGLDKLEGFGAVAEDIDAEGLRRQLRAWRDYLTPPSSSARLPPPLPRIQVLRRG